MPRVAGDAPASICRRAFNRRKPKKKMKQKQQRKASSRRFLASSRIMSCLRHQTLADNRQALMRRLCGLTAASWRACGAAGNEWLQSNIKVFLYHRRRPWRLLRATMLPHRRHRIGGAPAMYVILCLRKRCQNWLFAEMPAPGKWRHVRIFLGGNHQPEIAPAWRASAWLIN